MRWPQPDKVIKRPEGFWRPLEKGGVAPDEVTLRFVRPPGHEELSDEELDALLENRVLAYEKEKREKRIAEGKTFLCDETDERPDPKSFPKTRHKLFGLSPLIGAAIKELRLAAIWRLRAFRRHHKDARLRMQAKENDVVFPYGTYQAVQRWAVAVESAPAPT